MLHWFRGMRWIAAALLSVAMAATAQSAKSEPSYAADSQMAAALRQVSAQRIQADIEKLVSFGTRSTLSAQDPASISAGHGIGAAREWVKSQFEAYAKECGGCLEVKTDEFVQPVGPRVPQPTTLTNVYAILKGTDPDATKRIV